MIDQLRWFFEEQTGDEVVSAYLFGSHAQQRAHSESDVDVGVLLDRGLLPSRAARFDLRLRLTARLDDHLHAGAAHTDLLVLNDAGHMIGRAVITSGIRLIVRDAEADHAYCRDIQLRAADLEPFVRRMRRIKLEALAG